jgi:hypothetical protein
MKTLLKLLVVVAVLNAAYRFGMAEYRFSQLKETTKSVLVLGTNTPVEELRDQILRRAGDLELPVPADSVVMTREGVRTSAKVSYHQEIEIFPGYRFPRDYSFSEEIAALR